MDTRRTRVKMKPLKVLLLVVCLAAPVYAQQESVTIGPGDTLHVKVLEASELEQSARVTDAGTLPLIAGGDVKVAGLTPYQASSVVEHALISAGYVLKPHVSVAIEQSATQNVTVMGQVRSPGSYPIGTPRTMLDVLALAGGLSDLADRQITLERHATGERVSYLYSNEPDVALEKSVMVFPGDRVIVPKSGVVYVIGDVNRPGGYPMSTNDSRMSVLQAVSLAGGTPPSAVPSHSRLVRKQRDGSYVEIDVQLSAMQKGKSADMQLQADDILYVPFSYLRNMAMGVDTLVAAAASASIYRF
jgi:polysaccharide export outer membrane protein